MSFKTVPYAHQLQAFEQSKDREYYGYFMEMGTGKSKVAIDNFCYLYQQKKIDAVFIIANNGSYRNWSETQIPTHMWEEVKADHFIGVWKEPSGSVIGDPALDPEKKFLKIFVMNVEALAFDKGFAAAIQFVKGRKVMFIVDESTTVKNLTAKRTKSVINIASRCAYRRIMTGDPITNSPLDLYAQCQVLKAGCLGFSSFYPFRNYFAVMFQQKAGQRAFMKVTGYQNLDKLASILKGFSYRVKKEDCLDLPPKVYQKHYVEMTDEQQMVYNNIREDAIAELNGSIATAPLVITKMIKLHQIVCGHFVDDEGKVQPLKSNRVKALMDVVEESNGKVIIWANYRNDIQAIATALAAEYGFDSVATYYGETSDDDRVVASREFQNGALRFLVSNQQTGAFGNTWTAASTVIYYSNNYQLELRRQSEDRCHRIGLTHSVNYVDLICKGTVDEKIVKALRSYSQIASATLGETWKEWI